MRRAIVFAAVGLIGLTAGFLAGRASDANTASQIEALSKRLDQMAEQQRAAWDGRPCADTSAVNTKQISRAVQQALIELRALSVNAGAMGQAPSGETGRRPSPSSPTPEVAAAMTRGLSLLDDARKRQRWGNDQAGAFRLLLPALDDERRGELLRELSRAINDHEFEVGTDGPPF